MRLSILFRPFILLSICHLISEQPLLTEKALFFAVVVDGLLLTTPFMLTLIIPVLMCDLIQKGNTVFI
jgi:hypothetical protein